MKNIKYIKGLFVFVSSLLVVNCTTVEDDDPNTSQGEAFGLPINDRQGTSKNRLNNEDEAGGFASRVGQKITLRDLSIIANGRTWSFPEGSVDVVGSDNDNEAFTKDVEIVWKSGGFHAIVLKPNFTYPTDRVADSLYFRVLDKLQVIGDIQRISNPTHPELGENETYAGTPISFAFKTTGLPNTFELEGAKTAEFNTTIGNEVLESAEYESGFEPQEDDNFVFNSQSFLYSEEDAAKDGLSFNGTAGGLNTQLVRTQFNFNLPGEFDFSAALRSSGYPDSLAIAFKDIKILKPNFPGTVQTAVKLGNTITFPVNRNIDLDNLTDTDLESFKNNITVRKITLGDKADFSAGTIVDINKVVKPVVGESSLVLLSDELKTYLDPKFGLAIAYNSTGIVRDIFGNEVASIRNNNVDALNQTLIESDVNNILEDSTLDFGSNKVYRNGNTLDFRYWDTSTPQQLPDNTILIATNEDGSRPTVADGELRADPLSLKLVKEDGAAVFSTWKGAVDTDRIEIKAGKSYHVGFWAKTDTAGMKVEFFGGIAFEETLDAPVGTWKYYTRDITPTAGSNAFNLRFRNGGTDPYTLYMNKLVLVERP